VRAFLHEHWQANHPMCNRALFDWQYRCGSACRVAVDGEHVLGFLGVVPGRYRWKDAIVDGAAMALWVVHPEFRNTGLGLLLMRDVESQYRVCVCLGVNPTVLKYYTARGYRHLSKLHRYVAAIDVGGYSVLLPHACARATLPMAEVGASAWVPMDVDAQNAAKRWIACENRWALTLHRDAEFWPWRYARAEGFRYMQFASDEAMLIARREGDVLRVIEIVAGDDATDAVRGLMQRALRWAGESGCVAADFQCSSSAWRTMLMQIGFRERDERDSTTLLPEVFEPVRHGLAPINCVIRTPEPIDDFDATYFVKSDGDMDRPRVAPGCRSDSDG